MQLPIATMADGEPHCPDRRVWRGSDKLERVLLLGRVVSEQVYDLGGGGTAPRTDEGHEGPISGQHKVARCEEETKPDVCLCRSGV